MAEQIYDLYWHLLYLGNPIEQRGLIVYVWEGTEPRPIFLHRLARKENG